MIADALGELGIRSVLCYETSDRDGPERAQAGIAENRRFLERVRTERPPLAPGDGRRARVVHALRRDAGRVRGGRDRCTSTWPRTASTREPSSGWRRLGALDERTLLAHGVHLDDDEIALVREAERRSRTTPART